MFSKIFKIFLLMMSAAGIYLLYQGIIPVIGSIQFLLQKPHKVSGVFDGYDIVRKSYSDSFERSGKSQNLVPEYYPKFSYTDQNGRSHTVKSYHKHLFEIYKKGDTIEVYLPADKIREARIAGFLAEFSYPGLFLITGSFMIIVSLFFYFKFPWTVSAPDGGASFDVDILFNQFWERINQQVNLRWIPGVLKNVLLLVVAVAIAYSIVIWKPWQIPVRGNFLKAAYNGDQQIIKEYIEDGYNLDITNDYDQTALNIACEQKLWEIARLLISAGAAVNIESKMHRIPLDWAVQQNDTETALMLIDNGSPVNGLLTNPLSWAYVNGNMEVLEALMKAGADLQKIYPEVNMTFGDMVKKKNDTRVVEMVKKYGGRFTY